MPMNLGVDVSIGRNLGTTWFLATQYNDLSVIADFNRNLFALPALDNELITNGTFDTDLTGWVQSNGSSAVLSGQARLTANGSTEGRIYQAFSTVIGEDYMVKFSKTDGTATGRLYINNSNTTSNPIASYSTAGSGTFTVCFRATATTTYVILSNSSVTNGVYADYDNVSIKRLKLRRGDGELGPNLAASGYTMSVNGGTGTATESPSGQLNLTGDGSSDATGKKTITTVIGTKYRCVFTVADNSLSGFRVGTGDGLQDNIVNQATAVGSHAFEFTATATTTHITFRRNAASLSTVTNIAIQAMPTTGAFPKRAASFDEVFAYTASSTTGRVYTSSSGQLKNDLSANIPRIDHRNGRRQIRLEDARTNIVSYSDDYANSAWTKTRITIGSNEVDGPFGPASCDAFIETSATGQHELTRVVSIAANTAHSTSVIVAADYATYFGIGIYNSPSYSVYKSAIYNLNNGTVQSVDTGFSAAIRSLGSFGGRTFYLCTLSGIIDTTSTSAQWYFMGQTSAGTASWAGSTGRRDLYVAHIQIEAGAWPSDPIPTTSASVTRAIETARFSPVVEHIVGRTGAYAVIEKGIMDEDNSSADATIIGHSGTTPWPLNQTSSNLLGAYDGTNSRSVASVSLLSNVKYGAGFTSDALQTLDLCLNGTLNIGTKTFIIGKQTQTYLRRNGPNYRYGFGLTDFVGFSPERLTPAQLQALAIAIP